VYDLPPLNDPGLAFPALIEAAGRPAVAFGFSGLAGPQRLRFVRADDAEGTAWTNYVFPDGELPLTSSPSLFSAGGLPVIAYSALAGGGEIEELRIVRAADAETADWEPGESIGEFPDIELVGGMELLDGRIAIAFHCGAVADDPGLAISTVYFAVEQ
jgi:hypothetical protein